MMSPGEFEQYWHLNALAELQQGMLVQGRNGEGRTDKLPYWRTRPQPAPGELLAWLLRSGALRRVTP